MSEQTKQELAAARPSPEAIARELVDKHLGEHHGCDGTCWGCLLSAEIEAALQAERAAVAPGWQPIANLPDDIKRDGTVILRPHVIYGAMDVRWKPCYAGGKHYNWINGDYTTAWPDEALAPFWMPLPAAPPVAGQE